MELPPPEQQGWIILLQRAQGGDRAAFDQLVHRHRPLLLAAAFVRTGDREVAEDLVQEALAQAWSKLVTLRELGAFPGWLRAILVNRCATWRRRYTPELDTLELLPEDYLVGKVKADPIEDLLATECRRHWQQTFQSIPAANRSIFILHVLGEYTCAEIARLLALPLTTVEGRIHRAKQQLVRVLCQEDPELRAMLPRTYQRRVTDENDIR